MVKHPENIEKEHMMHYTYFTNGFKMWVRRKGHSKCYVPLRRISSLKIYNNFLQV